MKLKVFLLANFNPITSFYLFGEKPFNPYRVASVPKHLAIQVKEDENPGSTTDQEKKTVEEVGDQGAMYKLTGPENPDDVFQFAQELLANAIMFMIFIQIFGKLQITRIL